jgi:hypothetical protein
VNTDLIIIFTLFVLTMFTSVVFILKYSMESQKTSGLLNTVEELKNKVYMLEQDKELQVKEDFIMFLDQSRDMAFEYIENSQKIIQETLDKLSSGKLNKKQIKEISDSLTLLLPSDDNA